MPNRELYVQGTQEQQLPGIKPPPGQLKTSALTIGPSMSLAHLAAQIVLGGRSWGGQIELGLRKQPYRLNQCGTAWGGQTTETRRATGLRKPERNRMPLATGAPVQRDKTRGAQEGRTLEAGGGGFRHAGTTAEAAGTVCAHTAHLQHTSVCGAPALL